MMKGFRLHVHCTTTLSPFQFNVYLSAITHPCGILLLAQARPRMSYIYTSNELRSRDNTSRRGTDIRRCAAALRSTAAASAPLWPLALHCGRFRSTAAASAPLWPLPLHCGRSMSESDCVSEYVPQRSALMGHHISVLAGYCGFWLNG